MSEKYTTISECRIEDCNDLNVPVNIDIVSPEDSSSEMWELTASQFQPRKERILQNIYEVHANSREVLIELVRQHVIPLYINALARLQTTGELYFWSDLELKDE